MAFTRFAMAADFFDISVFCLFRASRTTENSPAIHRWDHKILDEVREADD
jgi:hypothetical protein